MLRYGAECPTCHHHHPFVDDEPRPCDTVTALRGNMPDEMRANTCGCTEATEAEGGPSIVCPDCGFKSYHPSDVTEGYCGRCHWWTSNPMLVKARAESRA